MLASMVFLGALGVAGVVLVVTRPRGEAPFDPSRPTVRGWIALALGLTAAVTFAIGATGGRGATVYLGSIASTTAAVMIGLGALAGHDRHWPTWAGLATAAVPAVGWIVFAIGNLAGIGG